MLLSCDSFACRVDCDRGVVRPVDLDVLRAGNRRLHAGAARLERDRAGGLDHAQRVLARPPCRCAARRSFPRAARRSRSTSSAPSCLYWSMPELNPTTGIFAALAALTAPASASGVTSVVAMPLTFESTAFWIRVGLLRRIGVVRVLQGDALVLGGLLRPGLDLVPEGVTGRLVGDHGDRVTRAPGRVATGPGVGGGDLLAAAAACGHGQSHDGRHAQQLGASARTTSGHSVSFQRRMGRCVPGMARPSGAWSHLRGRRPRCGRRTELCSKTGRSGRPGYRPQNGQLSANRCDSCREHCLCYDEVSRLCRDNFSSCPDRYPSTCGASAAGTPGSARADAGPTGRPRITGKGRAGAVDPRPLVQADPPRSAGRGEGEARAGGVLDVRPTRGHDLRPGVEADALRAVHVLVPEE